MMILLYDKTLVILDLIEKIRLISKIKNKDKNDVLGVIDELMSTLQILQPKLYKGVLRKIDGLS